MKLEDKLRIVKVIKEKRYTVDYPCEVPKLAEQLMKDACNDADYQKIILVLSVCRVSRRKKAKLIRLIEKEMEVDGENR